MYFKEYLSSLGIIHRDLACSGIVGDNKNLKISDFGMSRYLTADEVYINTSPPTSLDVRGVAVSSGIHFCFRCVGIWSSAVGNMHLR